AQSAGAAVSPSSVRVELIDERGTPSVDVIDARHKAVAVDRVCPKSGAARATYFGASDQHGKPALESGSEPRGPGKRVWLVPGHCDAMVDRNDGYVGVWGAHRVLVAGRGARDNDATKLRLGDEIIPLPDRDLHVMPIL